MDACCKGMDICVKNMGAIAGKRISVSLCETMRKAVTVRLMTQKAVGPAGASRRAVGWMSWVILACYSGAHVLGKPTVYCTTPHVSAY